MINTTLNEISKHEPCKDLWEKLLRNLDKTEADNEPLPLIKILEISGLNDAKWCLSFLPQRHAKTVRLFTCDLAEHVLHFFEDEFPEDEEFKLRPRRVIKMARLYTEGGCKREKLMDAIDAAADAVYGAAAAKAAAWAAWFAAIHAAEAAACADEGATVWATSVWDAATRAVRVYDMNTLEAEEHWQKELFIKYFG